MKVTALRLYKCSCVYSLAMMPINVATNKRGVVKVFLYINVLYITYYIGAELVRGRVC